mgnify:CR=1 FL=1
MTKWALLDGKEVYTLEKGFYKYIYLRKGPEAEEKNWAPVWILHKGKSKKEYYVHTLYYESKKEKLSFDIKDINDFNEAKICYIYNTRHPADFDPGKQPAFFTEKITEIRKL